MYPSNAEYPEFINMVSLRKKGGTLVSGSVPDDMFWFLIDISAIRSERIINALHFYLVVGKSRKYICEQLGVNNGYFSTCLARLERVNQTVIQLIPFYIKK